MTMTMIAPAGIGSDDDEVLVEGIWDDSEIFTRYRVRAQFTGRVMGGVPQKPEIIEAWLRQRVLGGDEELRLMLIKTLDELGVEVAADASRDEIIEATKAMAATRNGNTFRRDRRGLFLAGYQVKAMLKECVNILYAGERWGVTRKGPRSYLAERVFVDEDRIHLGQFEPDGTHLQIGQVNGPRGPRSTLTYVDFCEKPEIAFTVSSLRDCIEPKVWKEILLTGQREGLGAMRSLGYGQFKITGFDRV